MLVKKGRFFFVHTQKGEREKRTGRRSLRKSKKRKLLHTVKVINHHSFLHTTYTKEAK